MESQGDHQNGSDSSEHRGRTLQIWLIYPVSSNNVKEEPICVQTYNQNTSINTSCDSQHVTDWLVDAWLIEAKLSAALQQPFPSLIKILSWLQTCLIRLFIMSAQGESFRTGWRWSLISLNDTGRIQA